MKKLYYLLIFTIVALLLAVIQARPALSWQQEPPLRSPDLIRELYEGDPLQRRLPVTTERATEELELQTAASPPYWTKFAIQSFRNDNWDIYQVNYNGSSSARVTSEASVEAYPDLKAGCERVVFASDRAGNFEIYAQDVDGSDLLRLTYEVEDDILPAWSSDGSRIAFQSYRNGNSDIFMMDADGSNVIQLTSSDAYDGHPSWSPDGTQIVFSSFRTGRYELWIVNTTDLGLRQLTFGATALQPAWSPTEDKIAYANDGDGDGWLEVWLINTDGSLPDRLINDHYAADHRSPSWSPDGKWLSFIETEWINYYGQWYWTYSYFILQEISSSSFYSMINYNRTWDAHWASIDPTPPTPCTINAPLQSRWNSFIIDWSAEDVGPSGIDSFDVQMRQSTTATWQEVASNTSLKNSMYKGNDGEQVEFRCRARDNAGNVTEWADVPVASTVIDGGNPHSYIDLPQRCVKGDASVSVQWGGSDQGSEIVGYDVFVRDGDAADWELWQDDVVSTTDVFTGALGHTYYFRSQARDAVDHVEPWQPSPQAALTFYSHVLSGTVTDNRGQVGMVSAIDLEPSALYTATDSSTGIYSFYLEQAGDYTLGVSALGYGNLETELSINGDTRFNWVLPPQDEVVVNGGFETGSLLDWSVTGYDAQVISDTRHSGYYALQINHATSGTLVISGTAGMSETLVTSRTTAMAQSVGVDQLHQPTLSFMYYIPSDLDAGVFSVRVLAGTASVPVFQSSAATPGWTHAWVDLSAYAGQNVTLVFELDGGAGVVWLDEISVGSWHTPQVHNVSPQKWYIPQTTTLTLTGQNFIATPSVFLDQVELDNVTWVSTTQLSASTPETLTVGVYDLAVVNPNGSTTVLQNAVATTQRQVFLPLILRHPTDVSGRRNGTDWTTLGYDVAHTGYNRVDPGASRYTLAWTVTLPNAGIGRALEQVAVADGVLVLADELGFGDSSIIALDAETGQELWSIPFSQAYSLNPPSIAHGAAYFQKGNHADNTYLFCVDLYNGTKHWQAPFLAQWERYLAPVIVGESVYINGGYTGGIYGFNAVNGKRLWLAGLSEYDLLAPAYADGKLYTWVPNSFRAHDPDTGWILWELTLNQNTYVSTSRVAVIANQTAFVANGTELSAIDLSTQLVLWSVPGYNYATSAVADDIVYALNDGTLQAHNASDGALLWSFEGDGALKNAPVIAGNYVYVASDANTYVLNRSTHELEWQTDHGGWLTVANGFLYIAQADKTIYAYRAQEP